MVLTAMIFAQTDGKISVLLDHTYTKGPSVIGMRDFFSDNFNKSLVFQRPLQPFETLFKEKIFCVTVPFNYYAERFE